MSVSEFDTDIKMENEDNDLDTLLQCVIDDIKLLRLRLTATRSYVEILQKQLNEAMQLEQELDRQLNRQLDNEVRIRNRILLTTGVCEQNELSLVAVVNSQDQQTSNIGGGVDNVAIVRQPLFKPLALKGVTELSMLQQALNKSVTFQNVSNIPTVMGLPACSEILTDYKSGVSCTLQVPSNPYLKPYPCHMCNSSFARAKNLRRHIKESCKGRPQDKPSNSSLKQQHVHQLCKSSFADVKGLGRRGKEFCRYTSQLPLPMDKTTNTLSGKTSNTPAAACNEVPVIDKSGFSCTTQKSPTSSLKQFVCQMCGSSFARAKYLRRHIKEVDHSKGRLRLSLLRDETTDILGGKTSDTPDGSKMPVCDKAGISCTIAGTSKSSMKRYLCQKCGSSFAHATGLRRHIRAFCRGWPLLPLLMDKTSNENELDKSCVGEADGETDQPKAKRMMYKCPVCQVFCSTSQGTITRHVRRNICQIPLYSGQEPTVVAKDVIDNVLDGVDPVDARHVTELARPCLPTVLHQCTTCLLCYQSERSLQKHLLIAKCGGKQMLSIRPDNHNSLRSSVQTSEIINSSCFACGKPNVTEWSNVRSNNDRVCLDCEKLFIDHYILDSSQDAEYMEPSDAKKRFVCLKCRKGFGYIPSVFLHLRSHTGYRPHVCYRCGKAYSIPCTLKAHLLLHDQENSSANFKCDICSKLFFTETRLKMHKLVHSSERPFVCSFCGKAYAIGYELKIHMRNHTGIRPYACTMCPKAFMMSNHLKKHMNNNHIGKKMNKCPVCSIEVYNLQRHHREIHLGLKRRTK